MFVKEKIGALFTAIVDGGVDRWWNGLGLSKKTDAALKAIGIFVTMNVGVFGCAYIIYLVFTSPVGRWLELNRRNKPYLPGTIWLLEVFLLIGCFLYYREKVKGTRK